MQFVVMNFDVLTAKVVFAYRQRGQTHAAPYYSLNQPIFVRISGDCLACLTYSLFF